MVTTARPRPTTFPRYSLSGRARSRIEAELLDLQAARSACAREQTDLGGDVADIAELASRDMTLERFDQRIAHLRDVLANADSSRSIVDKAVSDDPQAVRPGVVIALRFGDEGETERFVVGDIEERAEAVEVITPSSPLGRALIGSRPGDKVEWATPRGKISARIVDVEPLPELLAS